MHKQRIDRIARAFMALTVELAEAARAGEYNPEDFKRRTERNRAAIAELATSDDARLRRAAVLMSAVLADLPGIDDPDVDRRLFTNGREWERIMTEVTADV